MKANIKLPIGFVVISSILALAIAFISFSAISVILIIGVVYLVVYLLLGAIKRKDALVIGEKDIVFKTPFKNAKYEFDSIKSIYITSDNQQLKGVVLNNDNEEEVKFFSDIYDKNLVEIYEYIINKHPNLAVKKED